jgi:hypothetical protein
MAQTNEEIFEIEPVTRPKINRNREKIIIKTPNYEQITKRRQQREKIKMEWTHKIELLELNNKKIVYPNQQNAADMVIQAYDQGVLAVCLIAQPGTGKTGTAQAIMYHYATHDNDDKFIFSENIFPCSGMADNDWEEQFKDSLLPSFKNQVYHRQNLLKQELRLGTLINGLIIPDECHIASQKNMTVAQCMKKAGLLDIEGLKARNIKTLDISATPEAVLHDYAKWGPLARIIKIQPGPTYKGFKVMLDENRIIDAPILETLDDIEELLETFESRYVNSLTKKYYPFRLFNEDKKALIRLVCEQFGWAEPLEHDSTTRIDDIDKIMETAPLKHQIIFIKGFWRASKRLVRAHVGGSYEQKPKKTDMTNTAQSLTGRFCDNYEYSGDQLDPLNRPLHYCDIEAIRGYVEWFNSGCDFTVSEYKSLRINSNGNGKVKSKASKVHDTLVTNLPTLDDLDQVSTNKRVPIIVDGLNETDIIFTATKRKDKIAFVLSILKDNDKYTKLLNFINNPKVLCAQITQPNTNSSYKKHITDVVNASISNTPYSIDLKDKDKNNWQLFIDNREKRLCFVVWSINQELY